MANGVHDMTDRKHLPHTGRVSQARKDALALEKIGSVDLDKVETAKIARVEKIRDVLNTLDELADNNKLSDWEYDFFESVNNQFIARGTLSDKQYEKILQIELKYE